MPVAADLPRDRVSERRRVVALAHHYRQAEGLTFAQIAGRLGRSRATIRAYFYDPTGKNARAVKARYQGVCRRCGVATQPRNAKGDAYAYCKACHPGASERRWTRERVLDAMREWRARYGRSNVVLRLVAHPRASAGAASVERVSGGDWPSASAVTSVYGSWRAARAAAADQIVEVGDGQRRSQDRIL